MRHVVPFALLSRLRFARAACAYGVFALLVAHAVSGCSDSSVEHEDDAALPVNEPEAGEPERDAGSDAAVEQACVFDIDDLLQRAGAPATGPRINCGSFNTNYGGSDPGHGVFDCFEQQAFERKRAVEERMTWGLDSGPVTTFIAAASGELFSVRVDELFFPVTRGTASVESCQSLDRAGSGEVYCTAAVELYRCSK